MKNYEKEEARKEDVEDELPHKVLGTILAKVKNLEGDDFAVACVKKIRQSDIEAGKYSHLELAMKDGILVFLAEQIPDASNGKFSDINVNGKELVLKDQPTVLKTFSVEAPNWGDSYNGTHTVDFEREVYQREGAYVAHRDCGPRFSG